MWLIVVAVLLLVSPTPPIVEAAPITAAQSSIDPVTMDGDISGGHHQHKRQFDVNVGASFEEQLGAELSAEVAGTIWRNAEGTARLDGSATYGQHFDVLSGGELRSGGSNGKGRAGISFHYHHD